MVDKRFSLISVEYGIFEDNETGKGFDIYKCVDTLNELANENEELKQREERLLSEIEDFQELLAKNDNVCHKRVIDLIDDRIFNFSNVKVELLLNSDDDYRLEKLSFAIQNLRELKEELSE